MHNVWVFLGAYAQMCGLNVNRNYFDNTIIEEESSTMKHK